MLDCQRNFVERIQGNSPHATAGVAAVEGSLATPGAGLTSNIAGRVDSSGIHRRRLSCNRGLARGAGWGRCLSYGRRRVVKRESGKNGLRANSVVAPGSVGVGPPVEASCGCFD